MTTKPATPQGSLIGCNLRLSFTVADGSVVTFSARVFRDDGETISVVIPDRVRRIRFTDWPERAYRFPRSERVLRAIKV